MTEENKDYEITDVKFQRFDPPAEKMLLSIEGDYIHIHAGLFAVFLVVAIFIGVMAWK